MYLYKRKTTIAQLAKSDNIGRAISGARTTQSDGMQASDKATAVEETSFEDKFNG
jgi:hypothetical protein